MRNQNCTNWSTHTKFIHILHLAGSIKIKIADILLGAFLLKKLLSATIAEKLTNLQKRNQILNKVKDYIDTNLDQRKVNIMEPEKPNFLKPKEISDIL